MMSRISERWDAGCLLKKKKKSLPSCLWASRLEAITLLCFLGIFAWCLWSAFLARSDCTGKHKAPYRESSSKSSHQSDVWRRTKTLWDVSMRLWAQRLEMSTKTALTESCCPRRAHMQHLPTPTPNSAFLSSQYLSLSCQQTQCFQRRQHSAAFTYQSIFCCLK